MFKPQLKRATLQSFSYQTQPSSKGYTKIQGFSSINKQKQMSLVPEAFFQESKKYFFQRTIPGLTGAINTCQYNYPKAIQDQISNEKVGNFQYNEHIFCFYKEDNVYFWEYDEENFTNPKKFLKHTCNDPITSVYYKEVIHKDFGDKSIKLVAIAFGQVAKLYRLQNFQKENNNSLPFLENLMVSIYSPQIITNLSMIYEESIDSDPQKNFLAIILGDANGNLILFDWNSKHKYITDTLQQKIKRKVQKQNYSEILQILPYKQFIFCLVKRYYQVDTTWKIVQKIFRNERSNINIQQRVEVYKIQLNAAYNSLYSGPIFTNSKIQGFKKHCLYTSESIGLKIKGSYSKYFEKRNQQEDKNQLGYIQSLSLRNGFVQLMFRSGQSILVDQDISFAEAPLPCIKKPYNFGLLEKNVVPIEEQTLQKSYLLKSIGTKLMLFEGFIASAERKCLYFIPFSTKQNNFYIRSIKQYQPKRNFSSEEGQKFLILGHKNMIFVQKISPKLVLFLYSAAMSQQFPHKKYIPQSKKFQQKIDKIIDWYGQTQVIIILLQLLMSVKLMDSFKINLRMDLFQLICKQVSNDQQLSYKQAIKCYEQNEKNYIKNTKFTLTKDIEQIIWRIIFRIQKIKIQLPRHNEWNLKFIESICMAIQVIISQIFKNIKDWTARHFCAHRNETYKIISEAKVLEELIDQFLRRQAEGISRKGLQYYSNSYLSSNLSNREINSFQSSQGLKIKFCNLSKNNLQKLILLLKVYDYVCEMDLHGTQIPKFCDLLFNFNQIHRIKFSSTILRTLGINNQSLIDNLILKIPQLQFQQVRRFNLWESMHEKSNFKTEEINKTLDSTFEGEIQEIYEFINEVNYKQISDYYLCVQPPTSIDALLRVPQPFEKEKEEASYFINGVTILLRACLKKILSLRQQQIQITNAISIYRRATQDYYGVLELPSLERKVSGLLKQIQFFTKCCEDLIQKIFDKFSRHLISKQEIHTIIDFIKNHLTIEVRKKIEKCLEKEKLLDLSQTVLKRQLFSNIKGFDNTKKFF